MKIKNILLMAVIVCGLLFNPHTSNAQQWTVKLKFYEDSVLRDSLEFGINNTATDQIDKNLGESELPPLPPFGNFDVRFTGNNIGLGLKKDIRVAEAGQKIHTIAFQRSSYSSVITVEWDSPPAGDFTLQDKIGGILIDQNMSAANSLTITNTNITGLKIFVTLDSEDIPTGIDDNETVLPKDFLLYPNYPNPFNPVTTIKFELRTMSNISMTIFNAMGQKIRSLINGRIPAGSHSVVWNGLNDKGESVSSGTYFYVLNNGKNIRVKKMVLLK